MAARAIARRVSRVRYVKARSRRKTQTTIPLGIIAGLAPTAMFALEGFQIGGDQGGIKEAAHRVTMRLTGYEWKGQVFSWPDLVAGWLPLAAGIFAHKAANRFGINRMLARAGVPLLRI